jgi:hypothetical protein
MGEFAWRDCGSPPCDRRRSWRTSISGGRNRHKWDYSAGTHSGRKSARNARVEVLVRADRRRSWTAEQKREIVAESLALQLRFPVVGCSSGGLMGTSPE